MENTSLGYHTFAFFQKTKEDDFFLLTRDFILYANKNSDMKRFPVKNKKGRQIGWEYTYENNKGIRWLLISVDVKNGYIIQGVTVIINPKALIENNYIRAAQAEDLKTVENLFNNEAEKISPLLLKFGLCSLNRLDPCLNIDLKELDFPCSPKQMMTLIKRGNIPKHYEEKKIYDKKLHRMTTDKNSFYLKSDSVVINYYWKYPQQNSKHPNYIHREKSYNVIRLEVQCKYPKLYSISKNIKNNSKSWILENNLSTNELYEMIINENKNPSIPLGYVVLSDKILDDIICKYYYKIIRKGDYFTLDGARSIVESHNFRRDKEERIIYALEQINKFRGIANAKAELYSLDLKDFKRSLKDLDDIQVNPVTIPRKWKIKYIPNLLHTYYNSIYDEQMISKQEYLARKHINEFLYN